MMLAYGQIMTTRGRCLTWSDCFPSETAYYAATLRLRKAGVIAYRRGGMKMPVLEITPNAAIKRRDLMRPDRLWNKKWRGVWSVLTYDVAESERRLRDALRRFLQLLKMGCFQKSVWISAHDIRPDYDDLVQSIDIDYVAYLFEAHSVFGKSTSELVSAAWDFDRLDDLHAWYLSSCDKVLHNLEQGKLPPDQIGSAAQDEMAAFLTTMKEDPLLPKALHPPQYEGERVLAMHHDFVNRLKKYAKHGNESYI